MDEKNLLSTEENFQIHRQNSLDSSTLEDTEMTTEVDNNIVINCDIDKLSTINLVGIFLLGTIIGLLVISIFTKRWHT